MKYLSPHGTLCALLMSVTSAQEPPALRLTRDLRIDAGEHDLSPITSIVVSPNGTIAINQQQDGLVRFFDATGKPAGTFGRRGQGPGEFMNVGRLSRIADTLVVTDPSLRRYTLVSPDLKLVRTVPRLATMTVPAAPGAAAPQVTPIPVTLYGDGSWLVTARIAEGSTPPNWPGGTKSGSPLVRVDSAGAFQRLVAWRPESECDVAVGTGIFAAIPFCAPPLFETAMDGSRIALSWVEESRPTYRVVVLRVNGDTVFNRTYPYQPVAIPNAAMDSAVRIRSRISPEAAAVLAKVKLPGAYPPLERVLLGRDETTWLEIYPIGPERKYLALDARGNPAGTITLPRNVRVMAASRENVWAAETDEDGLQHIVRYKVAR